ncbi:pyrroloquinoline-quinone synthase PqqC [Nitrogeniibacter aestuarii]|uniref:pyrroloquinoline-quinone synthase PqqC n=1 Tax=Nitrogeniibacter aestuarii TaxID=2815343 RepID=UPI001D12BC5D|nr:pyrroloquinoline-quinone synthase PqqC [Nitrogeniibacter aestuarii]
MQPNDVPTPHLATINCAEPPMSREEFEGRLREKGTSYHIHHPIHKMMADGKLTQGQIQRWVANRYLYQVAIPVKDANIMANCPDREIRREWIQRILDHDGYNIGGEKTEGGIEAWIQLGMAVGLTREDIMSERLVAPAARFAVDAYVTFARNRPWQDAVASSLTELFAPHIHQQRLDTWPEKYPWIQTDGLQYFRNRLTQARRDVAHGLQFTLDYFGQNRALQERALEILQFKLDVLWSLADAIMLQTCEVEIKGPKV